MLALWQSAQTSSAIATRNRQFPDVDLRPYKRCSRQGRERDGYNNVLNMAPFHSAPEDTALARASVRPFRRGAVVARSRGEHPGAARELCAGVDHKRVAADHTPVADRSRGGRHSRVPARSRVPAHERTAVPHIPVGARHTRVRVATCKRMAAVNSRVVADRTAEASHSRGAADKPAAVAQNHAMADHTRGEGRKLVAI